MHGTVEFLGANVLDEKPFIVMPYLANGNARDYLQEHPNADRLQIVCMSHVCIFVLAHFDGTCAAAWHFSGTCSSPLTSDCTWRLKSSMLPLVKWHLHILSEVLFVPAQCAD
jgi:hypothetical protein